MVAMYIGYVHLATIKASLEIHALLRHGQVFTIQNIITLICKAQYVGTVITIVAKFIQICHKIIPISTNNDSLSISESLFYLYITNTGSYII